MLDLTNNDTSIDTDFFTLHKITDGVYAAIAKPGKGAWSNAGFVDLGDDLLVFDAFSTPMAARELRRLAEELTGKNIAYLVNSHYHGDHVFGNQIFADVPILATTETKEWHEKINLLHDVEKEKEDMEQYLQSLQQQIDTSEDVYRKRSLKNQFEEMFRVKESLDELVMVSPNVIFKDRLHIHGKTRSVELICFGGGHSPSDTLLYLPDEKIAFMGDIVTEKTHLPLYDPQGLIDILQQVKGLDIKTVIPGHGNVGSIELMAILENYLSFLLEEAAKAKQNKISEEVFISEFVTPHAYLDWSGPNGIQRNLKSVYNHMQNK